MEGSLHTRLQITAPPPFPTNESTSFSHTASLPLPSFFAMMATDASSRLLTLFTPALLPNVHLADNLYTMLVYKTFIIDNAPISQWFVYNRMLAINVFIIIRPSLTSTKV